MRPIGLPEYAAEPRRPPSTWSIALRPAARSSASAAETVPEVPDDELNSGSDEVAELAAAVLLLGSELVTAAEEIAADDWRSGEPPPLHATTSQPPSASAAPCTTRRRTKTPQGIDALGGPPAQAMCHTIGTQVARCQLADSRFMTCEYPRSTRR